MRKEKECPLNNDGGFNVFQLKDNTMSRTQNTNSARSFADIAGILSALVVVIVIIAAVVQCLS